MARRRAIREDAKAEMEAASADMLGKLSPSTTGKKTQSAWDSFPKVSEDHPIFKAGFIVGIKRSSSSSPNTKKEPPKQA
jgi:hypothetical protein